MLRDRYFPIPKPPFRLKLPQPNFLCWYIYKRFLCLFQSPNKALQLRANMPRKGRAVLNNFLWEPPGFSPVLVWRDIIMPLDVCFACSYFWMLSIVFTLFQTELTKLKG